MPKSEPQLTEVTIGHSAGGGVHIRSHAAEKSDYSYFESQKITFGDDWTEDEVRDYVEEQRQVLRERVDIIASAEHEERFNQSYLS